MAIPAERPAETWGDNWQVRIPPNADDGRFFDMLLSIFNAALQRLPQRDRDS